VTDHPQQPKQPGSRGRRARGGDVGDDVYNPDDDNGRDRNGRPKADPVLTRRFEQLEEALHGRRNRRAPRALLWSGVIEPAVTFQSIEGQLELPPDRPTSDLPDGSQSGG
jgi:hypothetical protein